jgi:hypothetical protein
MRFLRNLDLVVAVLALAIFIAASLPIVGWITGAGIYVLQRAIATFTAPRTRARSSD